jgi:hypothetical protein
VDGGAAIRASAKEGARDRAEFVKIAALPRVNFDPAVCGMSPGEQLVEDVESALFYVAVDKHLGDDRDRRRINRRHT